MNFGKMISAWKNVLLSPKTTLTSEAARSDLSIMDPLIAFAIAGVFVAIAAFANQVIGSVFTFDLGKIGTQIVISILTLPIAFIASIIGYAFFAGLIWAVAMVLGGKASYAKLYYVLSTFAVPISIVTSVFSIIPCIGPLVSFVLGIYSLLLLTIGIKRVYGFDNVKAVVAWLVPGVVVFIISVIIAIIMFGIGTLKALLGL